MYVCHNHNRQVGCFTFTVLFYLHVRKCTLDEVYEVGFKEVQPASLSSSGLPLVSSMGSSLPVRTKSVNCSLPQKRQLLPCRAVVSADVLEDRPEEAGRPVLCCPSVLWRTAFPDVGQHVCPLVSVYCPLGPFPAILHKTNGQQRTGRPASSGPL